MAIKFTRSKLLLILAFCLVTLQFTHCSDDNVFTVPANSTTMTVRVNKGEEFTIKIRGNPTTGYGWFLDNKANLDTKVLLPLNLNEHNSGDYQVDSHPEGMVGVGGSYFFKFLAKEANANATLRFILKRPWESDAFRTVNVNVNIR